MAGEWTYNWKTMKNALLCGDFYEGLSQLKTTDGNLIVTVGTAVNYHEYSNIRPIPALGFVNIISSSLDANRLYIKLGSGSAAPAATDYNLENELGLTYLSIINEKPTWNTSTGVVSNVVKLTVQNTGAGDVVIREWGLFGVNYNHLYFLLYRALLDSPVTLDVNQAATLTLTRSVTLTDPVVWPTEQGA